MDWISAGRMWASRQISPKNMWKRFLAVYEKIEDIIAGIGLVCGVGIMFVGVVARYIFHHPLTFVDEIGPIFIVWSTLIG